MAWAATVAALLVAGCTQAPAAPPPAAVAPHAVAPLETEGYGTGLTHVRARIADSAGGVQVWANATNEGIDTRVAGGCQGTPWSERLESANGTVLAMRRPLPRLGCPTTLEAFPARAQLNATFTWNGTLWRPDGGHDGAGTATGSFVPAPVGSYAYVVSFRAESDREGPAAEARLAVEVRSGSSV